MRSIKGICTLVAVCGLALSACSKGGITAPSQSGSGTKAAIARSLIAAAPKNQQQVTGPAWTRNDIEPATDFTVVGSTVFFLGVQRNQLYAFGLDLATGNDKFRIGASPSGATPGVAVGYGTLGDTVAFYGENEDLKGSAPMWLVNLKTGKRIHTNRTLWRSSAKACDHQKAICGSTDGTTWRADLATGELTYIATPAGRALGDGLSGPLQRNPEMLTYTKNDQQQWSLRLQDVVPGATTDHGWATWSDDTTHMVGIGLSGASHRSGDTWTFDLSDVRLLGIEQFTGHVAWTGKSQQIGCGTGHPGDDEPLVRCQVKGSETIRGRGDATQHTFTGVDVVVQGFDPKTGATTWQVPLGNQPRAIDYDAQTPTDSRGRWILPTNHGLIALDPHTGAHDTQVTDDNWCQFSTHIVIRPEMTADNQKRVGSQLVACDRTGKRRDAQPASVNTTLTPVHSGIVLIPGETSLSAFRVSPPN